MSMSVPGVRMRDETSTQTFEASGLDRLSRFLKLAEQEPSPEQVCSELAKLFTVKPDEVALLKLEKGVLRFLFPPGLKTAGTIPITGSAVAARTAATRSNLLSNSFAKVKHIRIFEDVKSGIERTEAPDRMPIQKLMSVPVLHEKSEVRGV